MKRKKQLSLYLGLLLLASLLMTLCYRLSQRKEQSSKEQLLERDLPEIVSSGVLRVVTTLDGGHDAFSFLQEGSTLRSKIQRLSDSLGVDVALGYDNDYARALEQLLSGEVDIVAREVPLTTMIDTTLLSVLELSILPPIYLVQRSDTATLITRQVDLAAKTITLPDDSPYKMFVEHLSDDIGANIHIQTDSLYALEQLALQVMTGKIDYTICREDDRERLVELSKGTLDVSLPISFSMRGGWLVRKSSVKLLKALDSLFVEPNKRDRDEKRE